MAGLDRRRSSRSSGLLKRPRLAAGHAGGVPHLWGRVPHLGGRVPHMGGRVPHMGGRVLLRVGAGQLVCVLMNLLEFEDHLTFG